MADSAHTRGLYSEGNAPKSVFCHLLQHLQEDKSQCSSGFSGQSYLRQFYGNGPLVDQEPEKADARGTDPVFPCSDRACVIEILIFTAQRQYEDGQML